MIENKVWKFSSYSVFMKAYLKSLPNEGRGYSVKIAKAVGIHPTLLSQILRGGRDLTMEQASLFCDYVKFNESEVDYFLKLVELSRAGNQSLKAKLKRQLQNMQSTFEEVRSHITPDTQELNEEQKSIFYSTWQYSAFRMLCSLDKNQSLDEMAETLNLSKERTKFIAEFLLQTGLIVEAGKRYKLGPSNTHVNAQSMWSTRHHLNWRTQHLRKVENISSEELCFTAPFSCSQKDFFKIREFMLSTIKETTSVVAESPAEAVYSLCIDLFKL